METWEYQYQYVIRDETVMVAPMFFECCECDYKTFVGRDIIQHHKTQGHFYKMTADTSKAEEWKASKHPDIPMLMHRYLPEKFKEKMIKYE